MYLFLYHYINYLVQSCLLIVCVCLFCLCRFFEIHLYKHNSVFGSGAPLQIISSKGTTSRNSSEFLHLYQGYVEGKKKLKDFYQSILYLYYRILSHHTGPFCHCLQISHFSFKAASSARFVNPVKFSIQRIVRRLRRVVDFAIKKKCAVQLKKCFIT